MAAPAWEGVATALVAQRGDALHRYALLLCGDTDDAADLVQDAMVKTFGRLGNGFTLPGAEAYVRRTILTAYLDRARRRTRWWRIAHLTLAPESADRPDSDTRLDLLDQLRRLSPRERACVVLRYYEDLKVDDVAGQLSISAGSVKRYLSDALAKLSIALTPAPASDTATAALPEGSPHGHRG